MSYWQAGLGSVRLRVVALGVLAACVLLLFVGTAHAALIAQMARCTPPFDTGFTKPGPGGYGNDPAGRTLNVDFVFTRGDPAADVASNIASTDRVEICWIDQGGTLGCPAWKPGGSKWLIFDKATSEAIAPGTIKANAWDPAITSQIRQQVGLPIDWEDWNANLGKILFIVVNAQAEPTKLADVTAHITNGGFCGVPYRLAAAQVDAQGKGVVHPSVIGSVTAADIRFVLYGIDRNNQPHLAPRLVQSTTTSEPWTSRLRSPTTSTRSCWSPAARWSHPPSVGAWARMLRGCALIHLRQQPRPTLETT